MRRIAAGYEKDEDQLDTQEDAPMIDGVIDERPDELITKQDFVESSKWKRLGVDETKSDLSPVVSKENHQFKGDIFKTKKSSASVKVRSTRHDSDSDPSPPRKRHDSDPSPPRKRHDSDSDPSPPRRRHDSDQSPPRKRQDSDSDASPPRKRHDSGSDLSPPRRKKDDDSSPPMRQKKNTAVVVSNTVDSDGDLSPVRPSKSTGNEKLTKTLDGKRAGLQTGKALREETEEFRRKEDAAFRSMDKSLTGQFATTSIRAGKRRQMEAEQEAEKEKAEKVAKLQEAYNKWNKGLKQGEAQSTKLAEDIHEMSKPLARFAGDEDLEQMLREQDREGDPMAAYMAKKKAKSGGVDGKGKTIRPVYRGPAAAPNRFGILPGYRWDGVDRSNGYEKLRYEKQSSAVAIQEEAYKWSVSDM